jgi:hypothetical protein
MEDARAKTAVSSTQENAFMVLAAEVLADKFRTIAFSPGLFSALSRLRAAQR